MGCVILANRANPIVTEKLLRVQHASEQALQARAAHQRQEIIMLWLSLLPAGVLPGGKQTRHVGAVLREPLQPLYELRNSFQLLLFKRLCRQQGNKSGQGAHLQRESPAIWRREVVVKELV